MRDVQTEQALTSAGEQEQISRALLSWLNQYPDKPVDEINYEYLEGDKRGMALSTIQGAYKIKSYLRGGYQAQYQFKILYRVQPSSNNARLKADEILDKMGDWITAQGKIRNFPEIGAGKQIQKIVSNTRADMFARYENGDEDHQILMTLYYASV